MIVGLAPGRHGANRTGQPFTGDASGRLLFDCLARHRWSPESGRGMRACRITNAVRCFPPENRPTAAEVRTCNAFLTRELHLWRRVAGNGSRVLVALGRVAHDASLLALGRGPRNCPFEHARVHRLDGALALVDAYHPSRQNVNTNRLTPAMLDAVIGMAATLVDSHHE